MMNLFYKLIILVILIDINILYSQAYLTENGSVIKIGNQFIERTLNADDYVHTTGIYNKLSGANYSVNSNEFTAEIVFAGFGPAIGKAQNGENPSGLTAKDFHYKDYQVFTDKDGSKTLKVNYSVEGYLFNVNLSVYYFVNNSDSYIKKWIEVYDTGAGINFLDRINVEDLSIQSANYTHAGFGQPVFCKDIFLAVEYPAVENLIDKENLKIGYVVGKNIQKEEIKTFASVIGVAQSEIKLEQTFMKYVEQIKVNGTRPYLLYNSWYDFRNPAIAEGPESIMNDDNVLNRIETFKKYMVDKYGIHLNAFVLDDGWDDYNSIWEIDTKHLPNKFSPFINPLKKMNTVLGIWASPFCGYSNREKRVKWGSEHGYEHIGDFLCFAGKNYKAQFEKKMVEYVKDFNIGYFKWDGFLLACNEPDHGHLPGVYSRTELISTYMHMMNSVRKINPDIFINVTVGSWLSPWWLKYADCIWMQGEDYAYAEDVPSMNPRDKAITYRDAVLWDNLQNQKLLFPMSSLMTHGIIKGRLNFLGGKNESLVSFTNETMMYFGRGVMMWELYVSPDLLSDGEWNAIAKCVKWSEANKDVLINTKMILGNPLKREAYGYVHMNKDKAIIMLRNPYIEPKKVTFSLDESFGELVPGKEYYIRVIYPYNKIFSVKYSFPGSLNFDLNGYEILLAELVPAASVRDNFPVNVRFDINDQRQIILYGEPGSDSKFELTGSAEKIVASFDGLKEDIKIDEIEPLTATDQNIFGQIGINVPFNNLNPVISFLIEPKGYLKDEKTPRYDIEVNDVKIEPTIEQENGKWFWVTVPIKGGENKIKYNIDFSDRFDGRLNIWLLADKVLNAVSTDIKITDNDEVLPPKPYSSETEKVIIKIK